MKSFKQVSLFVLSFTLAACSASSPTPTDPVPRPADPRAAQDVPVPPGAPSDRGALVRTIAASQSTKSATGITVWAGFQKGTSTSIVGLDAAGNVKTEVGGTFRQDGVTLSAPGAGAMDVDNSGKVLSSTFRPSKVFAFQSIHEDYQNATKDAPYWSSVCDWWLVMESLIVCLPPPETDTDFVPAGPSCVYYPLPIECLSDADPPNWE
jgi:hypothetical protein